MIIWFSLFALKFVFCTVVGPWTRSVLPSARVCVRAAALAARALVFEEGFVHEGVVRANHFEDALLRALHDEAADNHFLQNEIGLVEVEDQVQLAHVAKVSVEHLYEVVDHVQHDQLVVVLLDAGREVKTRVSLEDNFVLAPL